MIYKTIKNDIEAFCEKVNAEKWTDFVGAYSEIGDSKLYGGKHGGSDAEHEGAEYIAQRLKEIGVGRVEFVKTPASRYQFNDSELKIIGVKEPMEIRPYGYRSPGTDKKGITAQLIDAGTATRDELKNINLKGKIAVVQGMDVLEAGNLIAQMEECIISGAAAVLIYAAEDILNEDTIRVQTPMNVSPIPIVGISMRHAKYLKGLLEQGEVTVNLTVDCDYTPGEGTTYNVVGEIPGSCSDEKIVYTAHLDHFFRCLQDNMASCAALLGIAEAIIKSGYKPKRSIIFAFNGSHECGMINSKYPYITGSYGVVKAKEAEWKNKVIADINFEYAALKLEELKAVTSIGNETNLCSYLEYAPELTGGFDRVVEGTGSELYNGLSWCDGISYCTAGILVYTNDILSEQLEGKSEYIGRDHSNHDNWESYSTDTLRDSIRYYGGFGIYLDSLPYIEMDFAKQSQRMRAESEFDSLDEEGIKTAKMRATLKELEAVSGKLLEALRKSNERYLTGDTSKPQKIYEEALKINEKVLALFDCFQQKIDGIAPSDFLVSRSGKYLMNIGLFGEAEEALKAGDTAKALEQLLQVDMAGISYYFSRQTAERMCRQINGKEFAHTRTWASGKELKCSSHYELMSGLKTKIDGGATDFDEEIKLIGKAAKKEMIPFIIELKKEFRVIKKAIKKIEKLEAEI